MKELDDVLGLKRLSLGVAIIAAIVSTVAAIWKLVFGGPAP
jgi:hypothetical protein